MQPPDAPTAFLFKLWPWIEANRNRLIVGGVMVVIAGLLVWFYVTAQEQKEIAAGTAYTQLALSVPETADPAQWADAYLKIANEYPGTLAGRRAWLQGAAALLAAGKYADAQAQFQKFLDAHPDGDFSASAALGVAASLEALGKLDLAVGAYQRVVEGFPDVVAVNLARLALARIAEQQGKFTDALNFYETIVRSSPPDDALASEAAMRSVELQTKLAPAKSTAVKP